MMNFNEKLNIKYPIIQGGMAHIASGKFAASVSNAGAMGLIGSGSAPVDIIRKEIRECKENTDQPFGLNIMMMHPNVDDIFQLCIDENIKFVTTGAGNPEKYIKALHQNGILIYPVIPTLSLAKRMQRIGADGIIAEGMEAGGHIGFMTTFTLLPQVAAEIDIPIIAAGGIYSGQTMLAAEILGASGVQMGTAFLSTEECPIHEKYKEKILSGKSAQITVIGDKIKMPVRLFKNSMTRQYLQKESEGATLEELEYFTIGALARAVRTGDLDEGSVMAGLVVGSIKKRQSVAQLLSSMMEDYTQRKEALKHVGL